MSSWEPIKLSEVIDDVEGRAARHFRVDRLGEAYWVEISTRLDTLRCVECGAEPDAVHWRSVAKTPTDPRPGCPIHDLGGYWMSMERLATIDGIRHILRKHRGEEALHSLLEVCLREDRR